MDRAEFGAMICEALEAHGLHAVLTGGSCVSVWTDNRYESRDLDFVVTQFVNNRKIAAALEAIGMRQNRGNPRYFHHPDYPLDVEFPRGPLAAGEEMLEPEKAREIETDEGTLRLLAPTDCVKDRLANYLHFRDEQCLDQAVDVASSHPVQWNEIDLWLQKEGRGDFIGKFRRLAGVAG